MGNESLLNKDICIELAISNMTPPGKLLKTVPTMNEWLTLLWDTRGEREPVKQRYMYRAPV